MKKILAHSLLVQQAAPPIYRALAFRGYVRLCREARLSPSERLVQLTEAARLAASTDEKMLVGSALADLPEATGGTP